MMWEREMSNDRDDFKDGYRATTVRLDKKLGRSRPIAKFTKFYIK